MQRSVENAKVHGSTGRAAGTTADKVCGKPSGRPKGTTVSEGYGGRPKRRCQNVPLMTILVYLVTGMFQQLILVLLYCHVLYQHDCPSIMCMLGGGWRQRDHHALRSVHYLQNVSLTHMPLKNNTRYRKNCAIFCYSQLCGCSCYNKKKSNIINAQFVCVPFLFQLIMLMDFLLS